MMVQACHSLVDSLDNYIKTKRADSFESALFLYYLYRYYLGYRTKRVGFIGDGASKLLAPSPF